MFATLVASISAVQVNAHGSKNEPSGRRMVIADKLWCDLPGPDAPPQHERRL